MINCQATEESAYASKRLITKEDMNAYIKHADLNDSFKKSREQMKAQKQLSPLEPLANVSDVTLLRGIQSMRPKKI